MRRRSALCRDLLGWKRWRWGRCEIEEYLNWEKFLGKCSWESSIWIVPPAPRKWRGCRTCYGNGLELWSMTWGFGHSRPLQDDIKGGSSIEHDNTNTFDPRRSRDMC